MIIDGRQLPSDTVLHSTVCIIGAGMAGLTLASELADQGFQTCLIESGGATNDPETQMLGRLDADGSNLAPTSDSRQRQLGGSANLWNAYVRGNQPGARFLPLDEIDFEKREAVPFSGWPFGRAKLVPFYRRAERVCGIRPYDYSLSATLTADGALPLNRDQLITVKEQFGVGTVFTRDLPRRLETRRNVTIVLHATAAALHADEYGRTVTQVKAQCLNGISLTIKAKMFVLAMGGIENARLLLLSKNSYGSGLGNDQDLVGRFFMDHHRINAGKFIPTDPMTFERYHLYDIRSNAGDYSMHKIALSRSIMQQDGLLNLATYMYPIADARGDRAVDSLKLVLSSLRQRSVGAHTVQHLAEIANGAGYLLSTAPHLMRYQGTLAPSLKRGGWSYLSKNSRRFVAFDLLHQCEQAPNPENRVVLSNEVDALGLRRARVVSRWSDIDVHTIARADEILAEQLVSNGLGRLVHDWGADEPDLHNVGGIHHHLGTTRMHDDPRHGVVDANARVHGVENLFVAGSSVFPTGGYANPSLTILALTIRLADHIKLALRSFSAVKGPGVSCSTTDAAGAAVSTH